jgi:hypothetical protein
MKPIFCAIACIGMSACSADVSRRGKSVAQIVSVPLNAIVLRVEVKAAEYTDWFDPSQCNGASDCVPQYFWYRYSARVSESISGEWQNQDVSFVHSQHAEFDRERTNNCYVVLVPAKDLEPQIKVDFIASGIYSRRDWKYDALSRTLLEK